MNYSALVAAAVLASAPMMASAAFVPIDDDGGTLISGSNDDIYTFNVIPGDGDFNHTFTLIDEGSATASVSLTTNLANGFTNLVAEWLSPDGTTIFASASPDAMGNITVNTSFADPGSLVQTLRISWASVSKGVPDFDGEVMVSTVPVPAGLLLMGTALAGLGMVRRRKV